MNTNLQAVAVTVTLSKKVTICSIYLPPNDVLYKNSLVDLINQLPHPFMLVGGFNGHSKVWGCSDTNDRGEIIEDVIAEKDLRLLNEKQPTYLHPSTGNYYIPKRLPFTLHWSNCAIFSAYCTESSAYCTEFSSHVH